MKGKFGSYSRNVGPKPPRSRASNGKYFYFIRYLHEGDLRQGFTQQVPVRQKVADYNKQFAGARGSRSTAKQTYSAYLERTLAIKKRRSRSEAREL